MGARSSQNGEFVGMAQEELRNAGRGTEYEEETLSRGGGPHKCENLCRRLSQEVEKCAKRGIRARRLRQQGEELGRLGGAELLCLGQPGSRRAEFIETDAGKLGEV
ncbi:hypothetical protein GCM10027056_22960 [Glaciibacter psychrotolerans]